MRLGYLWSQIRAKGFIHLFDKIHFNQKVKIPNLFLDSKLTSYLHLIFSVSDPFLSLNVSPEFLYIFYSFRS